MVGDEFLYNIQAKLQDIRSEAVIRHKDQPYCYQAYNIGTWYFNPLSSLKPGVVHILNSLIAAYNDVPHLPKYIVIFPDKDILSRLSYTGPGVKRLLKQELGWLLTQMGRLYKTQCEDLKSKRVGAVDSLVTKYIWIKMIPRPLSSNPKLVPVLKMCRKFNEMLEEVLENQDCQYVMTLSSVIEDSFFDYHGNLTDSGKTQFWAEFNHQLKEFDFGKEKLKPGSGKDLMKNHQYHGDHYHKSHSREHGHSHSHSHS